MKSFKERTKELVQEDTGGEMSQMRYDVLR